MAKYLYQKVSKKTGRRGGDWYYHKVFQGRNAQGSIGTDNKRLAQDLWEKNILPSILDGSYWLPKVVEPAESVQTVSEPSMREVIQHYMKYASRIQKPSSHKRNQEVASYWMAFLGNCTVSDVGDMAEDYREKRLAGEIIHGKHKDAGKGRIPGASTVKKEMSFLRQVINKASRSWTKKWPMFKNLPNPVKNPMQGLKDVERERYVTQDEAVRLADALKQSRQPYLREMIALGCQTGMRASNIAYLKTAQCDFSLGRINKAGKDMKSNKPFSVKMTSTVREMLQRVIKGRKCKKSKYVFVSPKGEPFTPNSVSLAFHRLCKRAGIEDLRLHDLRHDFASHLINNGASSAQIQVAMHHTTPRMTARYAHLYPENRDVVDRIDGQGTAAVLLGLQKPATPLLLEEK
ncbi:MAG: tyrosine-type recombinase/integrase [Thermodesulfovibrionales bacterium]